MTPPLPLSHTLVFAFLVLGAPATAAGEPQARRTDSCGDPLPPGAVARLGTVRLRHGGRVTALAFSPDGRLLASGGADGSVRLWDVETGKEVRRLLDEPCWVKGVCFANGGKELLAWGRFGLFGSRGSLSLWEIATGKEIPRFPAELGFVDVCAWTPDGKTLAFVDWVYPNPNSGAGAYDVVSLCDAATGRCSRQITRLPHRGAYALSPDGSLLASYGSDTTLALWETATGRQRPLPVIPGSEFHGFSADNCLLVEGLPQTLALYDPSRGLPMRSFADETLAQGQIVIAPGAATCATVQRDLIFVWDGKRGRRRTEVRTRCPWGPEAVALAADGKRLATGGRDNAIHVWDTDTGKEVHDFPGHRGGGVQVGFLDDGRTLVTRAGDDGPQFREVPSLRRKAPGGQWAPEHLLDVSRDGKAASIRGDRGMIRLMDTASGREVRRFGQDKERINICRAVFSPDSKLCAVVSYEYPEFALRFIPHLELRVWDVATSKEARPFEPPDRRAGTTMGFSSDGRWLAMVEAWDEDRGNLCVWEVATGRRCLRFESMSALHFAFSADGSMVAGGGQSDLWRDRREGFQYRTGNPLPPGPPLEVRVVPSGEIAASVLDVEGDSGSACFSRDGRLLAVGNRDGSIRFWDLLTGTELPSVRGHRGRVRSLAFSDDDRWLVSGGDDVTALVWDGRALRAALPSIPANLAPKRLRALWDELGQEGAAGLRARWTLVAVPRQAVPLLRENLRPVPAASAEHVARALADLDSDFYAVRERAVTELAHLEKGAVPALRGALTGKPSVQARAHIERLLEAAAEPGRSPEGRRALRALQVLEQDATSEARQVLERLAGGASEAWLTGEARATLRRVAFRQVLER
jgi:WD40 repeat protein